MKVFTSCYNFLKKIIFWLKFLIKKLKKAPGILIRKVLTKIRIPYPEEEILAKIKKISILGIMAPLEFVGAFQFNTFQADAFQSQEEEGGNRPLGPCLEMGLGMTMN
jgi:hypothetical protein